MTFDDAPQHQDLPQPHAYPPAIWAPPHYGVPGYQTGYYQSPPPPAVYPQQPPPPYAPHPYYIPPVHVSVHGPGLTPKSSGLAVLLAFLFGPLGMLYSTVTGALVIFCVNIVVVLVGVLTLGVGFLLGFCTWIAGMAWAYSATEDYNRKLQR